MVPATTARRRWRRGPNWRDQLDGWLFVLPWLIGFVGLVAGPMLLSVGMSFTEWKILKPPTFIGLENFVTMFKDEVFWLSLYNTAYYTFLGVPIYLVASLLTALLLNRGFKSMPIYRTIYFMPSLTPAVANALLWVWIFNPDFGLANVALYRLGLPAQKWLFDAGLAKACLIFMGLWGIGQTVVIFLAGLQGVPMELHEAAAIDGASSQQRFWHITMPMLSPTIFFNLVIGMIGAFQVFATAFIATNGGPEDATLFYLLYLYRNAFQYFKMGYASALAWALCAIIMFFTWVQFRVARRLVYYEGEEAR